MRLIGGKSLERLETCVFLHFLVPIHEENLGTRKGRDLAASLGVFEVCQNMEILEAIERQSYEIKRMLMRRYGKLKPVRLLMTIPSVGFLTALTLYAEICDIRRFSNPEKLAHYCGLVPQVHQSAEHTRLGEKYLNRL